MSDRCGGSAKKFLVDSGKRDRIALIDRRTDTVRQIKIDRMGIPETQRQHIATD